MNSEIKTKWIEALRSDRYKQGIHRLRCDGKHCCLGVLMDVVYPQGWDLDQIKDECGDEIPNENELEAVGLTDDDAMDLSEMNDCGKSFTEISDYIEANY